MATDTVCKSCGTPPRHRTFRQVVQLLYTLLRLTMFSPSPHDVHELLSAPQLVQHHDTLR